VSWRVRGCGSFSAAATREPRSEEYTGDAFHTWMFEPDRGRSRWRVAAQLVDGFADLNGPARQLFSMPETGLKT
jgi:hypothetical protein